MTKSELVDVLSNKLRHLSKTEVEVIIDTLFGKMEDALKQGNRIEIRGFGTFEVRQRPARQGRNPRSGATVYIQNRKVPFFRVGKELYERLNAKTANDNATVHSITDSVAPAPVL